MYSYIECAPTVQRMEFYTSCIASYTISYSYKYLHIVTYK